MKDSSLKYSFGLILLPAILCVGCSKPKDNAKAGGGGKGAPVPVVVAAAVSKDMPVELKAIGNVRPAATVTVKPRVGGIISAVKFEEGQEVKAGDVLYTIDAKPFEVALARAKAALAQTKEQARNAGEQAKRYTNLGKSGAVATEQLEQLASTAKVSSSSEDAAEAQVKEAEIQLGYCTIRSPISGRTGRRLVDAGNVVTANTTDLVVVNQISPIDVVFAIPEANFLELNRAFGTSRLKARAVPQGSRSTVAEGEVTFLDNAVKPNTGTLDVKASFPNADFALWPGQFAEVTLIMSVQNNAVVVPAPAVQSGQNGQYVFVIKQDMAAEMRPIELARTVGDEAVIAKGLTAGETVVVDGHLRVLPGGKVEVKPSPAEASKGARTAVRTGPTNAVTAQQ